MVEWKPRFNKSICKYDKKVKLNNCFANFNLSCNGSYFGHPNLVLGKSSSRLLDSKFAEFLTFTATSKIIKYAFNDKLGYLLPDLGLLVVKFDTSEV